MIRSIWAAASGGCCAPPRPPRPPSANGPSGGIREARPLQWPACKSGRRCRGQPRSPPQCQPRCQPRGRRCRGRVTDQTTAQPTGQLRSRCRRSGRPPDAFARRVHAGRRRGDWRGAGRGGEGGPGARWAEVEAAARPIDQRAGMARLRARNRPGEGVREARSRWRMPRRPTRSRMGTRRVRRRRW